MFPTLERHRMSSELPLWQKRELAAWASFRAWMLTLVTAIALMLALFVAYGVWINYRIYTISDNFGRMIDKGPKGKNDFHP